VIELASGERYGVLFASSLKDQFCYLVTLPRVSGAPLKRNLRGVLLLAACATILLGLIAVWVRSRR
jgi:hypothetical protein